MGDLVQGLGAVEALSQARPDWRLTFVTQNSFTPLLAGFAGLARVVPFVRRGGWQGVRSLWRELRLDHYDFALDLQGNWKSAAVAWLSGANQRLGMAAPFRQEPWSRVLLRRTIAPSGSPHPARTAWDLVRSLAPDAPFLPPRLSATVSEIAREQAALEVLGVDWRRPVRVVVVTDPRDPRALRPDVVELETRQSTLPVLHLMGPAEVGLTAAVGVPTLRHGRAEPRRLIALGHLVARTGGEVVGPDQGAIHVVAAAGANCHVLFGAEDPRRTAPPTGTALVHPEPPACSPCRARHCRHPSGPVCMDFGVAVGRVVVTDLPRFGEPGGRPA